MTDEKKHENVLANKLSWENMKKNVSTALCIMTGGGGGRWTVIGGRRFSDRYGWEEEKPVLT
jgi:hypothetical protein